MGKRDEQLNEVYMDFLQRHCRVFRLINMQNMISETIGKHEALHKIEKGVLYGVAVNKLGLESWPKLILK